MLLTHRGVKHNITFTFKMGLLPLILFCLFLPSCQKEDLTPPSIHFTKESGFIFSDSTVPIGRQLKTAVTAMAGGAAITNFVVTLRTENGTETALDSGLYTRNLSYSRSFAYGASSFEIWTFKATDKNGKTASVSFKLSKDSSSAYGPVDFYPSLTMGGQDNPSPGQFLTLPGGVMLSQDTALAHQSSVYLVTYYGNLLNPPLQFTFSSPSENDIALFYPSVSNWAMPKNEVRYKPDSLTLTPAMFDAATDDSLIIANYTSATVGKRKFKNARPGYVIPFELSIGNLAGKRGLIKVISVNGTSSGSIEFALKIQR